MSSKTIDTKVVEMQFDNKNFEKNVDDTLGTLDKLKEKLNFKRDVQGLEELEKASKDISFDKMADSVYALEKRFSTMGIIGMRVIGNLTDAAMRFASRTINFLTNGIVNGGLTRAMNLENAHFQLEGLIKDENEVAKIMKNVNDSVTGTAYSLDAAALVASQLAASGMRGGEDMFSILRGIAGVAAMTNSEYQQIGDIFTTVAGNGRLMSMQLLQLSGRGLNAAATIAEYLTKIGDGTEYTEAKVRDMISKGEIDFMTFAKAMDDAFGEHAHKANETLTGAMANTRAALAKIGAEFYKPLVEKNGPLVEFFNTVREQINVVKENVLPVVKVLSDNVAKVVKSVSGLIKKIDFSKFKWTERSLENLSKSLEGIHSFLSLIGKAVGAFFDILGHYLPNFGKFREGVLSVTGGVGEWLTKVNDAAEKTDFFGKIVKNVTGFLDNMLEPLKKITKKLKEKIMPDDWHNFYDLLDKIVDKLSVVKGWIKTVKDAVVDLFRSIRDKFEEFKLTDLFTGISNIVKTLTDGVVELAKTIGSTFSNGLTNLFSSENFNGILNIWKTFSMTMAANNFGNLSEYIGKALGSGVGKGKSIGILSTLKKVFGDTELVDVLDKLRWAIKKMEYSIEADTLMKIAKAVALLAGSLTLLAMVDSDRLNSASAAIVTLMLSLVGALRIMDTFSTTFTSLLNLPVIAGSLLPLASAMLILSFAVGKIASIDPDRLGNAISSIILLVTTLTGMAKVMQYGFLNNKTWKQSVVAKFPHFGKDMMLLAAGVFILAEAVKRLAEVDSTKLGNAVASIEILLVTLAGMAKWMQHGFGKLKTKDMVSESGFPKIGMQMIFLASAVAILAKAMEPLSKMSNGDFIKALSGVEVLLWTISGSMANLNKLNIPKVGGQLILLSSSIAILMGMMLTMKGMETSDVVKSVGAIEILMFSLVQSIHLLNDIKGLKHGLKGQLLALASTIAIIVGLGKVISGMSGEELGKAGIGLFGVVGMLVMAMHQLEAIPDTKFLGTKLIALGSAIMILSVSLKLLSTIPFLGAITALGLLFGSIMILASSAIALKDFSASLLAVSGSIALLGVGLAGIGAGMALFGAGIASLAGLTVATFVGIAKGIETILLTVVKLIPNILVAIGQGIVDICKVIADGAPIIGKAIKEIILQLIDIIRDVVPELTDVTLDITVEVLKSLATYTPELVKYLNDFLIGLLDSLTQYIPGLTVKVGEFLSALFSSIGDTVLGMNLESLEKVAVGIFTLTGIMGAMAALKHIAKEAMIGAVGVTLFVAELGGLLAALGLLSKIPYLDWLINEGGEFLASIGAAIGKFIGGFAGGIAAGFTSQIVQIADDLSEFMEHIQPFIEGAKQIESGTLDGVKDLTAIIGLISADSILESISRFITGKSSIDAFTEMIEPLGESLVSFSNTVAGNIDPEAIVAAANAGKILSELEATLPRSGGLWGVLAGDRESLQEFSEGLSYLAEGILDFSNTVTNGGEINYDTVIAAANIGKVLSELETNLPRTGTSLWSFIAGSRESLGTFADDLAPLAEGIVAFSNAVSAEGSVNPEACEAAAVVGKTLAELDKSLPRGTGESLWSFLAGKKEDLSSFAEKLPYLGSAIVNFSKAVTENGGINSSACEAALLVGQTLSELDNSLPDEGFSFWSAFSGEKETLTDFATKLPGLGSAIASFSTNVESMDISSVEDACRALKTMASAISGMNEKDMDISISNNFRHSVKYIGEGLHDYYESIKDLNPETLNTMTMVLGSVFHAVSAICEEEFNYSKDLMNNLTEMVTVVIPEFTNSLNGLADSMVPMGDKVITSLQEGITINSESLVGKFRDIINSCKTTIESQYENFKAAGDTLISAVLNAFNNKTGSFIKSANNLMTAFANALKNKKGYVRDQLTVVLNYAVTTIDGYYDSFYTSGSYLSQGFANGISANAWRAVDNARDMTKKALQAVKDAQAEGSPSKETYQSGTFFCLGFANAIMDHFKYIYGVGKSFTNEALDGFNAAIAAIEDDIDTSPVLEPVIRPVIDDSNIKQFTNRNFGIDTSVNKANGILKIQNQKFNADSNNGQNNPNQTFNFTQNNYSPKALSRIDIYRRTRNQFSALERMVRS